VTDHAADVTLVEVLADLGRRATPAGTRSMLTVPSAAASAACAKPASPPASPQLGDVWFHDEPAVEAQHPEHRLHLPRHRAEDEHTAGRLQR